MPKESSAQVSHIPIAPMDFYLAAGGTGPPGSSQEEAKRSTRLKEWQLGVSQVGAHTNRWETYLLKY